MSSSPVAVSSYGSWVPCHFFFYYWLFLQCGRMGDNLCVFGRRGWALMGCSTSVKCCFLSLFFILLFNTSSLCCILCMKCALQIKRDWWTRVSLGVCVCVLRNKSTRRSLAPPWQTWRSRLPLTTLSTRRSRRTTRSCASAPLAARWQKHSHSRSPAVGRLVLQAAHNVCFPHFAGRIHSPEEAVQHPDGELSRRRLSRPQLWNATCSLKI